jgi:uroporphyrin-III C-methyltransferase
LVKDKGKVYLVGAGPGNPKLLTIRALEVFKVVDVVLYDRLVSQEILELIPSSVRRIDVGKASHGATVSQDEINRTMVLEANNGNNVLRLKGGDPMLFSRGGEEIEVLNGEKISFEVVPGISSVTGLASFIGLPLTHRRISSSVAFVTGHEDPSKSEPRVDFERLASAVDTLVVLMGVERLQQISERLVRGGAPLSKPIAIIESGTTSEQKVSFSSLGEILDGDLKDEIKSPALIIIGEVVRSAREASELGRVDLFTDRERLLQEELLQSQTWCAAAEFT